MVCEVGTGEKFKGGGAGISCGGSDFSKSDDGSGGGAGMPSRDGGRRSDNEEVGISFVCSTFLDNIGDGGGGNK